MITGAASSHLGPRLVIAGTNSGVGKTTIATGLMAALRSAGHRVGSAKVGPDFIDPGYHSLATGRPSRNLDIWMCGTEAMAPLAAKASDNADVLIIEGVMGMFDGASDGTPSSTADVAVLLDAPIVLVVDAASMSQSVAAVVHGFASFNPVAKVAGVILNRVASETHEAELRRALANSGMPVLGVVFRDDRLTWRDRHLGLVPVVEDAETIRRSIDRLGEVIGQRCDLTKLIEIAQAAPVIEIPASVSPERTGPTVRIAVASGPAFSFTYPDNLDALAAAGAELVPFDPTVDPHLPDNISGLIAGGGFPEVFAPQLGANAPLLADVRARIAGGLVTWAECGGLLWLCQQLDGIPMAGVISTTATMTGSLTLGYRSATTAATTPLGPAATTARGHEFHYSITEPSGDLLELHGRSGQSRGGFGHTSLFASYLHLHLGSRPDIAESFVTACRRDQRSA